MKPFKRKQYYLNKEYMNQINKKDKDFIDSQLDSKLENEINEVCKRRW